MNEIKGALLLISISFASAAAMGFVPYISITSWTPSEDFLSKYKSQENAPWMTLTAGRNIVQKQPIQIKGFWGIVATFFWGNYLQLDVITFLRGIAYLFCIFMAQGTLLFFVPVHINNFFELAREGILPRGKLGVLIFLLATATYFAIAPNFVRNFMHGFFLKL